MDATDWSGPESYLFLQQTDRSDRKLLILESDSSREEQGRHGQRREQHDGYSCEVGSNSSSNETGESCPSGNRGTGTVLYSLNPRNWSVSKRWELSPPDAIQDLTRFSVARTAVEPG
jgi:hypothetical protein